MSHLLCVEDLTKTFPGCPGPVIDALSFCVEPGQVLALVGPSGCGKTTALRTIMGFERADRGRVGRGDLLCADAARGVHLAPEKRGIGFVFQDYALFPHLSVVRNVMFGIRHLPRSRRRQAATEALWMVGLVDFENRDPHDLSGGQQQRVALARAIAAGSKVILLDEPFSNLDPDLRQATRREIQSVAHRGGLGLILVTHDQEEALSSADRVAVMQDGRIVQAGEPESVYNRPGSAFVARFLGRTNLLEAEADGITGTCELGPIEFNHPARGRVVVSLRPEHIEMRPYADGEDGSGAATVTARAFKGHDITFTVLRGRRTYTVQTDHRARYRVGDRVTLVPRTHAAIVGRPESRVQSPESGVQSPESSVQSPESSVQSRVRGPMS